MRRARRAGRSALVLVLLVTVLSVGRRAGRGRSGDVAHRRASSCRRSRPAGPRPRTSSSRSPTRARDRSTWSGWRWSTRRRAGRPSRARPRWAASTRARPRASGRSSRTRRASTPAIADLAYSGGFAATGGAIALRVVGGAVVDAVGWGDATNAFVEGTAAPAPPAGSSLERLPGGLDGNGEDTQRQRHRLVRPGGARAAGAVGAARCRIRAGRRRPRRRRRRRHRPRRPRPTPTATPAPTATPTPHRRRPPSPTPTADADPDADARRRRRPPTPDADRDAEPDADADAHADADPDAGSGRVHRRRPAPRPTATTVTVDGVLTTDLGALESGRSAFVQDATAGIALYLDAAVVDRAARRHARPGDRRRSTRATPSGRSGSTRPTSSYLGATGLPDGARSLATGDAARRSRVGGSAVEGTLLSGRDELADGLAVSIDDGSGPVRLVIAPGALAGRTVTTGATIAASGTLGQRDSTGTGTTGYRLYVTRRRRPQSLTPPPTPDRRRRPRPDAATPTPRPSPTPDGDPDPAPTPTAVTGLDRPSPTPTAVRRHRPIAAARRQQPSGPTVTVRGTVTAEAGRLGTPPLIAIQDATGGIVVRLPGRRARARPRRTSSRSAGPSPIRTASSRSDPGRDRLVRVVGDGGAADARRPSAPSASRPRAGSSPSTGDGRRPSRPRRRAAT